MGVGRLVFRMFIGVTTPVPWVPAYAGTTVRGEGVLVGDDGCGGCRALPMGTGLRRHDGKGGEGVTANNLHPSAPGLSSGTPQDDIAFAVCWRS